MNVKLISITPEPEKLISYVARVSNPQNQDNPDYVKLIKFLIRHKHWSPFEHAYMTLEIKTSRAIAAQMIRHRSFSWQEYSQRYSEATEFEPIELRKQATKNRQSSLEVFDPEINDVYSHFFSYDADWNMVAIKDKASIIIERSLSKVKALYDELIRVGVAKETARFILPLSTQTTLYMTGSLRSWIHYLALRTKDDVQKEHRDIALQIQSIFNSELPIIATALAELQNEQDDKDLLYKLLLEDKYDQITTFKETHRIP